MVCNLIKIIFKDFKKNLNFLKVLTLEMKALYIVTRHMKTQRHIQREILTMINFGIQ